MVLKENMLVGLDLFVGWLQKIKNILPNGGNWCFIVVESVKKQQKNPRRRKGHRKKSKLHPMKGLKSDPDNNQKNKGGN